MNRIKEDDRNRLGNDILEHLLRIKIDGPALQKFDTSVPVDKYFSQRRHVNVKPYGPRPFKKAWQDVTAATATAAETVDLSSESDD